MKACKHCGGEVMDDGYAAKMAKGGLVELDDGEEFDGDGDEVRAPETRGAVNGEEGWELEGRQRTEGEESEQHAGKDLLHDAAFSRALERARYADGGMVADTVTNAITGASSASHPLQHRGTRNPDPAPRPGDKDYVQPGSPNDITPERERAQANRDQEMLRRKRERYGMGAR